MNLSVSRDIARFEHSLLSDSPVIGEPGWTLRSRMAYYHVPGVQVALLQKGRLVWTRGWGKADQRTNRPVTAQTLFDTGSVSKAVTALMVVKLADEGKFSLDTPVNTLLKSWKLPENEWTQGRPVTVRQLLLHQGGVSVAGFWGYLDGEPQPTLLQILEGKPPATNAPIRVAEAPGKNWRYSGGGYVILQQMLEDITGMAFAPLAERVVLGPLGMTCSTFVQGLPPALQSDVAKPSSLMSYFKGRRLHPHAAAAGLYSTTKDLARLIEAMHRSYHGEPGAFLSVTSARQMIEPAILDREPWDRSFVNRRNSQKDQALGWMRISRSGAPGETKYTYHDGLNAGFRSRMIFDIVSGNGAVILYNADSDEEFLSEVTRSLAAVYDWKDWLPAPIRPLSLTLKQLDEFCGRYQRSDDSVVHIRREGRKLVWTDLYTRSQPIYPVGNDRFEHRELFGRASEFRRDAQGSVTSLDGWPRLPANAPKLASEWLLEGRLKEGMVALRGDKALTGQRLFEIGFNLLEIHGLPHAAVAAFQVGTEKAPRVPGAWDALGDALKRAGKRKEGEEAERYAAQLRAIQRR
jgi:CubicO group peptidase (beta-lactamase class C family)